MASPDADAPVLSCEGVRYSYLERFPALDAVSLAVAPGERLALLGANGCGKSTLLKILDGLLFPSAGVVRAFGREVTEDALEDEEFHRSFRSRVGLVFQNADAQTFSPTVEEELAFGCLQLGLDAASTRTRIRDVSELLGISELAGRAPHRLSGGEKKRVAIGSVLVMNPDVLLFDEPTAALDPRTQFWLVELLGTLASAGKTLVLATHDLDLVAEVADRALVLGEDHTVLADSAAGRVLADRDLLLRANLIHERSRPGPGSSGGVRQRDSGKGLTI